MNRKPYTRHLSLAGIALLGWLPALAGLSAAEGEFTVARGQRQLFLDDDGISKIENLARTMHQPDKRGAVIRGNRQLGIYAPQTRMAPIWDPRQKVYKLWDCGTTPADLHAKQFYTCRYFESADGLHWIGPAMNQVEYKGTKANNLVSYSFDGKHLAIDLAVYDPTDEPARRFKWAVPNFGFLVSADGANWKKLAAPAVRSQDEYNLSFDETSHRFILTVKVSGPHGRSVALSTSPDFETWTRPELIFHADDLDQELGRENIKTRLADPTLQQFFWNKPELYNVDVYNMGVFRYEGLYVGMPAMYHAVGRSPKEPNNTDGFHLVQLASSRDLKTWKRLGDRKPFIGPSPKGAGAYDLTQIIGPSAPVARGDELWFYYTGLKYRDSVSEEPLDTDHGAICLATLRRDGFISLDAGVAEGWLLTRPFVLPKGELHLNIAATQGRAVIEVCDERGAALSGFEASERISGDRVDAIVHWRDARLNSLAGRKVCLRIKLEQAQLYSYWLR